MVWTLVEPGVAIVASSLVTIRPLLRQWRLKGFESSQRSRSNGLWARYGRSGGAKVSKIGGENNSRHHHHHHQNLDSKTTRSGGGMPGIGEDDVGLNDLEAGYSRTAGRSVWSASKVNKNTQGGGIWSRDTTLTSRTSTHDNISNNDAYAGTGTGTGRSRSRSRGRGLGLREDKEIDGGGLGHHYYHHKEDGDDDIENATTPVSLWPLPWVPADNSSGSSSESEFVVDGAPGMMRGHLQGGKPVWRTTVGGPGVSGPRPGAAAPNSPEESEGTQGLRQLDQRRDGKGRLPVS